MLLLWQSFWTVGTMAEAALASYILIPWGWRWLLGLSALPFGEHASPVILTLTSTLYNLTTPCRNSRA